MRNLLLLLCALTCSLASAQIAIPRPPGSNIAFEIEAPGKELYVTIKQLFPEICDENGNLVVRAQKYALHISKEDAKSLLSSIDALHLVVFESETPATTAAFITERMEHEGFKAMSSPIGSKSVVLLRRSGKSPDTAAVYSEKNRVSVIRITRGPSLNTITNCLLSTLVQDAAHKQKK